MFLLPHSVGGYSLTRKLGTGGVAESYLGTHEAGGKPVVVRRILPFVLRDPARLSSIEARIRDLLGVRHPFLVHVIDHIAEGEDHFLVEEYVNGVTLEQVLNWCRQSGHVVPHNVFLNIATQICNGLEALHGRSGRGSSAEHVLHLSIKPGSIFLSPEGKVLLGGYGLTRSPTTYPQGGVAGPVPVRMEYLSPEQTHTDQKLTPSSDVFSLGSLLYELLTLESLFRAESNLQTIHRLRRAEVTTPLLAVRDRLPGLDKVLFRALSLNPRHRYQRAFVLREDLRGLMAGYSFATIGEDTRNFLQPIFQSAAGGAESPGRGYVVGLDEAPDSPAGADSFADFPTTRIDPDPMSSAALAASSLAERVARERAEENKPERTERTEVNNDAELTPLPPSPLAAPPPEPLAARAAQLPESVAAPTPPPSLSLLPPASPNDQPEDTASYLPGQEPDPARSPEDTSSFLAAIDPVSAESAPPSSVAKKRKGRGQPSVVLVPANPPSPTLAPSPSPLAPLAADRPLPPMSAPGRAPTPTLAPDERSESDVVPPPVAAAPPPAAPSPGAGATLAPADAPPERPSSPLRDYLAPPAEAPPPEEEPLPPSRAPLFAGVALLAGGAVLACAGLTYWGMLGTAEEVPPPRPEVVEATAPVVAPAEDPAAVLAAMNPEPAVAAEEAARAAEASAKAAAEAEAKAAEAAKAEAASAETAKAEAARAEAVRAAAAKAEAAKAEAERAAAAKAEAARVAKASKESAAKTEAARAEAAKAAKAREVAASASAEKSARESAAAREAKARAAEEAKAAAEEKARRAAEAKAEAAEKSRVAAETKAAAAAASKAAAEEKARAAAEAKAAAARTTAGRTTTPAADASLAVVEAPPSTVLDGFVASARAGKLDATDVRTLTAVGTTDPQYTRSRALLLVDAQKRADDTAAKKYLDQLMVLPENQYNPVFLTDLARWHANHGEYERALEKAEKAERYWARLPSELVFSKKAEIYEIQAAATQGRFYKAKDDLELLERASAAWQKYRTHVATRDRTDLVKRADGELAKLADIKERLQ